jgi:hypothetical protein
MGVLDAIAQAPDPVAIPAGYIREDARRRIVDGVDRAVLTAAESLRTFTEQGVPWAVRAEAAS